MFYLIDHQIPISKCQEPLIIKSRYIRPNSAEIFAADTSIVKLYQDYFNFKLITLPAQNINLGNLSDIRINQLQALPSPNPVLLYKRFLIYPKDLKIFLLMEF